MVLPAARRCAMATMASGALDDVSAAFRFRGGPELAVKEEEAGGLEAGGGGEDVEPERRLDHELLRVGTPQYRLGRVRARVEHVPHPLRRDGQEMLPGAAPTAEEERGNDEEARHRFALRVAPLGGRVEALAYPLVRFVRVQGRLVVQGERVGLVLVLVLTTTGRGGNCPSE